MIRKRDSPGVRYGSRSDQASPPSCRSRHIYTVFLAQPGVLPVSEEADPLNLLTDPNCNPQRQRVAANCPRGQLSGTCAGKRGMRNDRTEECHQAFGGGTTRVRAPNSQTSPPIRRRTRPSASPSRAQKRPAPAGISAQNRQSPRLGLAARSPYAGSNLYTAPSKLTRYSSPDSSSPNDETRNAVSIRVAIVQRPRNGTSVRRTPLQ